MKELFSNQDADFCSLVEYVETFINRKSEDYNLFQLPPIQRNSVWNIAQIERLWDSILRGYPIGSFLVSSRLKNEKARDFSTGIQAKSTTEGYFLLDGQQRTRALLLGFKPNYDARIWIDLNAFLTFDNIELNDRRFLLRVLTNYQPWGMSDRNPSDKLNENQKFNARKELNVANIHYDYEIEIDNGINDKKSRVFSWPVKSTLPVPLDELINLCGGTSGKFCEPMWETVCKLIPSRYFSEQNPVHQPTEHYKEILKAIKKIIDIDNDAIKTRTIVLLFNDENKSEQIENVQDNMEVLFRRINAGGTVLQGEEMAYSLLKSSWDGAYEMVSFIVQNKSIGYILSSTGIVMLATRLARFIQKKNDVPNPSIGNFRKWIGEKDDNNSFLDIMQSLLQVDISGKSKLHSTMESFCNIVVYRENNPEDIGIPKKLLLSIKPAILHPVFAWIYKNFNNNEILESNRYNILRYLVYCFLTVDKYDKASKTVMELLKTTNSNDFPDKEIYSALVEDELSVPIPSPEDFSRPFEIPADGFFRHFNDVFNIPEDSYNSFRYRFWKGSRELLLWFQRSHASHWFKGYDPASNDAYDTPYDWDHIVPYSHLITSGSSPQIHSDILDLNKKFFGNRHLYVNSIGNFRLWPFWANRSDNNQCHTYKLRMEEPDFNNDSVAKELGLTSSNDFIIASAIPLSDEQLWYNAGGELRDWPQERREAWQNAVEKRTGFLFRTLFEAFGFSAWIV